MSTLALSSPVTIDTKLPGIDDKNVQASRSPQTLNLNPRDITTNLVQELTNKQALGNQKFSLEGKLGKLSENLKNVAYWILSVFVAFIPQIIFAIQKALAENKLQKVEAEIIKAGESIKALNDQLIKAQDDVKQAEKKVSESKTSIKKATHVSKGIKRKASDAEDNYNNHQIKRSKLEKNLKAAQLKLEKAQKIEDLAKRQQEVKARIAARRDAAAASNVSKVVPQVSNESGREGITKPCEATQKRCVEENSQPLYPEEAAQIRGFYADLDFDNDFDSGFDSDDDFDSDYDSDNETVYLAKPSEERKKAQQEFVDAQAAVNVAHQCVRQLHDDMVRAHGEEAAADIAQVSAQLEEEKVKADLQAYIERKESLRAGLERLRNKRASVGKPAMKPPTKPIQAVRALRAKNAEEGKQVVGEAREKLRNLELAEEKKLLDRVKQLNKRAQAEPLADAEKQAKEIFDEFLKGQAAAPQGGESEVNAPTLDEQLAAAREIAKKLEVENQRRLNERNITPIVKPAPLSENDKKAVADRVENALHLAGKKADLKKAQRQNNLKLVEAAVKKIQNFVREYKALEVVKAGATKALAEVAAAEEAEAEARRALSDAQAEVAAAEEAGAGARRALADAEAEVAAAEEAGVKVNGKIAAEAAAKVASAIAEAKAKGKVAAAAAAKAGMTIAEAKAKVRDLAAEAAKVASTIVEAKAKGKVAAAAAAKAGMTIAEAKAKGKVAGAEAAAEAEKRATVKAEAAVTKIQRLVRGKKRRDLVNIALAKRASHIQAIVMLDKNHHTDLQKMRLAFNALRAHVDATNTLIQRAKRAYRNGKRRVEDVAQSVGSAAGRVATKNNLVAFGNFLLNDVLFEAVRETPLGAAGAHSTTLEGSLGAMAGLAAAKLTRAAYSQSEKRKAKELQKKQIEDDIEARQNVNYNRCMKGIINPDEFNRVQYELVAERMKRLKDLENSTEAGGGGASAAAAAPEHRRNLNPQAVSRFKSGSRSTSGSSSPGSNSGAE